MIRKDIDIRHAPAAAGQLRSSHVPRPTAMREHRAGRRRERSRQGKPVNPMNPMNHMNPMNAPWPNAKTHRLFPVLERGCSQGQRLGVHPVQTRPRVPRAGQSAPVAQVAMPITGIEVRLAVGLLDADAAGTPALTAAAREQAALIAKAGMRAAVFEGVM